MERIGGMVWDGDGCKKERDTTCEIVDQSAVCAMLLCCASTSTQYIPIYATYAVHLSMPCTILCIQIELKTWNWKGMCGGEVYLFEE